jgi:hypothetical protein
MGFEQAPPYIYETMKVEGKLGELASRDWIGIFAGMSRLGFHWDPTSTTLKQLGAFPVMQHNTPWCHAATTPGKHCALDHNIIFSNFRIIHPRCQNCWKICMTIENFDHLRQIETMQLEQKKSAKCGAEMRDYTPKHYGAYWYTESLDEGYERYNEVFKDIKEMFGVEYAEKNIILKRGCTEFEMVKGPSPFWHNTKEEERTLDIIESFVQIVRSNTDQNEMIKTHVRLRQALWAHANGDMSYVPYNGGQTFFPDYVKYHKHDVDSWKHDMALAVGMAKGNISSETGAEFIALAEQFRLEHAIDSVGSLGHLLGMQTNSLEMKRGVEIIEEVPDDLKTEIT